MPSIPEPLDSIATIVDLPSLSGNFPPIPHREVLRDNIVNTLKNLVNEGVYAAAIEGPEGIGKTTLLSQFVRKAPANALSVFISAANRLSYDPDLIRTDVTVQVYWAITGDILPRNASDPSLLKSYYAQLQRTARQRGSLFYFIVDGVEELEGGDRGALLQQLGDILPVGIPQFRFLFSGDEGIFKSLLNPRLVMKSFPLTQFSAEETRTLFGAESITAETASELNRLCHGLPGRLTGVLRASEKGITPTEFLQDAPTKWPELFEIDWKQVDTRDDALIRILALLAHDDKRHTVADVSMILKISEEEVRIAISKVNFLVVDTSTHDVQFVSSGLRRFAAERLKHKKAGIQKALIKRLLANPFSSESVLQLPEYLEEAAEYPDLLDLLSPDHILQVLERSQTLSRVDDTVKRGFRGAKILGRDADLLRFGIQKSIIADLASAYPWESEVAALVALRHDNEALALANDAVLREDRLQMLATLAHGIWVRGDTVQSELIDQIRLLIDNLDFWSLGRRAGDIASNLTCVSPDLAMTLLKKAKWGNDGYELDRAFAHLTVSALRDLNDERRRYQAIETVVRSRQDPKAKGLLQGVRVLSGRLSPAEVCAHSNEIEEPGARISVLRYWCVLNGSTPEADLVAAHAIQLGLATPSITLNASVVADLSTALAGAPDATRKRQLVGALDGIRATTERLGPRVDYVRLQLSMALAEGGFDLEAAEGRLIELVDYVARIGDLPSRGEAYALFLGTLQLFGPLQRFASGDALQRQCASELESVVLTLAHSTAEQRSALGGIIAGLAFGDIDKALDYTRVVNTESRRDAVLVDVVQALLQRPAAQIEPDSLSKVLGAITNAERRNDALSTIMERLGDEPAFEPGKRRALRPILTMLPNITDSVLACRALVCALKVIGPLDLPEDDSLREQIRKSLRTRWRQIDVGWVQIDAGFGIARDLASVSPDEANAILRDTEALKSDRQIAAHRPAGAYVLCIRLVIRALCGLLPRRLETETDLRALAALIDVIPSYGERAVLWADLCMRAALAGRVDLTERLAEEYLQPAFVHVGEGDSAYRTRVLVYIAPALDRAQPTTCLQSLDTLAQDDRDLALRGIIRFLLSARVPFDPIDASAESAAECKYDTLLQVEKLTDRLETDWMIYASAKDVAQCIQSPKNRYSITIPQREDISWRFMAIANRRLPAARHIAHAGFRIVTLAEALSMRQAKPIEWTTLIGEADALENVADRVYVLQSIALCLPKGMAQQKTQLLAAAREQIGDIPWELDQIERYLGLAEDLQGVDTQAVKELVNRAATVIAGSSDDVREQRRRLVDVAYRVDEAFATKLIDTFDDDEAKRQAQVQVRLLEVRKTITDSEGKPDQEKILPKIRAAEVSRLGLMLMRSLNAGRVQTYHLREIRDYLEMAADQPLNRAFYMLVWYLENAVVRFSQTDQASALIRPMFNACVVGAQLAGQIAGRALVRLKALKRESNELSSSRSLLVTPGSRTEAVRVLATWLERHINDQVKIHDPYFGPDDLSWLQVIRTARPNCSICVLTSRRHQPTLPAGEELDDVYASAWRRAYDQSPPKAEIAIIGGEKSRDSPIHDRWLVSGAAGLRFGTSLNTLGLAKDSEISEMSPDDSEQKSAEMDQYLTREKTEHNGERLRLSRFWL